MRTKNKYLFKIERKKIWITYREIEKLRNWERKRNRVNSIILLKIILKIKLNLNKRFRKKPVTQVTLPLNRSKLLLLFRISTVALRSSNFIPYVLRIRSPRGIRSHGSYATCCSHKICVCSLIREPFGFLNVSTPKDQIGHVYTWTGAWFVDKQGILL